MNHIVVEHIDRKVLRVFLLKLPNDKNGVEYRAQSLPLDRFLQHEKHRRDACAANLEALSKFIFYKHAIVTETGALGEHAKELSALCDKYRLHFADNTVSSTIDNVHSFFKTIGFDCEMLYYVEDSPVVRSVNGHVTH